MPRHGLQLILARCRGGVGEWLKPPVLKTGVHFVDREFESRPLRQPLFTAFPSVNLSH